MPENTLKRPTRDECLAFWDSADNSVRVDLLCMNPVGCEHYSMIDKIQRYMMNTRPEGADNA